MKEGSRRPERYYELFGRDRGEEEIRKIFFDRAGFPLLIEFKDSVATTGLVADKNYDLGSVDPLTAFSWFFKDEILTDGCSKTFKIFDGKKRFLIKVESLQGLDSVMAESFVSETKDERMDDNGGAITNNEIVSHPSTVSCRVRMVGESIESSESGDKESESIRFWPFNKRDQTIDVLVVSKDPDTAFIEKIYISSPIGRIVGQLVGDKR